MYTQSSLLPYYLYDLISYDWGFMGFYGVLWGFMGFYVRVCDNGRLIQRRLRPQGSEALKYIRILNIP